MKKFLKLLGIFVAIFALQIMTANSAAANNVNFGQKILPVKFVYVAKAGSIKSIWSNVSEKDDVYAVKFFDAEKKNEIIGDQKMLSLFYQKNKDEQVSFSFTKKIQFIQRNNLLLEEITTVV